MVSVNPFLKPISFIQIVNEVFPAVFQPRSVLSRIWGEIRRHHRYIVIFTATGSSADSVRMLTAIQLLTVQSMLMFIMAVCYDLQYPTDNGTCAKMSTEQDCNGVESVFGSNGECEWLHEASVCKYRGTSELSVNVC